MARTRSEIKALAVLNTGRSDKDTLMNSLCDSALKVAVARHPFKDSLSMPSDFTITEDATSVDISASCPIVHIVTARIVEADGTRNWSLKMKSRTWWDKNVINAEDNQKGDPVFGMRWGETVLLDRPANSGLELRLRISTTPVFASDSTECPIEILDLFVEKYTTAYTFFSLEQIESFTKWQRDAMSELIDMISADKFDIAEEHQVGPETVSRRGVSIKNEIVGHEREGEVDSWY